jgi:hypothetical protein
MRLLLLVLSCGEIACILSGTLQQTAFPAGVLSILGIHDRFVLPIDECRTNTLTDISAWVGIAHCYASDGQSAELAPNNSGFFSSMWLTHRQWVSGGNSPSLGTRAWYPMLTWLYDALRHAVYGLHMQQVLKVGHNGAVPQGRERKWNRSFAGNAGYDAIDLRSVSQEENSL